MLLRNLILLIEVTFSTPTPDCTVFLCSFGGLCEYGAVPKRKIIVNIATTADGYVARTDGNLD
jgi:hypothetical protein